MNRVIIIILLVLWLVTGCSRSDEKMTAQSEISLAEDVEVGNTEVEDEESKDSFLYVYVCGNVNKPGVYPLKPGERICDALELAGGITEDGKPEALNQAECVEDGQTIYVPSIQEVVETGTKEDGLVDINEADKSSLVTLPGVGESKAELIIRYREEHGPFQEIEDLMKIPGIKEGVFNKIRDYIKVS